MPIARLDHVSVTVGDMDVALAFWRDALGLVLRGRGTVRYEHLDRVTGLRGTEIEWAELTAPDGSMIELFRYHAPPGDALRGAPGPAPNDRGAAHVCFQVTGLDALLAELHARGYRSRSPEPVEIPSGDWSGWRDVYVESPDGVIVELSEAPAADDRDGGRDAGHDL